MSRSTKRERKRRRLKADLAEARALIILSRLYSIEQKHEFEAMADTISHGSGRQLDEMAAHIHQHVRKLVASLKPSKPLKWYVDFVADAEAGPAGYLFIPKWQLLYLLPGISTIDPRFRLLPEHTLVSVDIHGTFPLGAPGELRILEAALFEDMAAHFNRAAELGSIVRKGEADKPTLKHCSAARRATVLSAFYVLEAYLNSIAFDYLVKTLLVNNDVPESSKELDLLAEWDSKRDRERHVAFRDKLLQYPKIVTGAEHPPLQESNCPEIRFLLEVARGLRDAVVHASPRPDPNNLHGSKEQTFWRLATADPRRFQIKDPLSTEQGSDSGEVLTRTVDSTIVLLRRLESEIWGSDERLFWVHGREANGMFADSVFE